MNHSNSPGFLYYDTSAETSNVTDNTDFIEFNASKSPQKGFSPGHYSSPTHKFSGGRGRGNRRNFPAISGQGRYSRNTPTFNISHVNANDNRKSYSGSPYHNSRDNSNNSGYFHNNSNYKSYNKSYNDHGDLSNYINPSMIQDPWAELERNLQLSLKTDSHDDDDS